MVLTTRLYFIIHIIQYENIPQAMIQLMHNIINSPCQQVITYHNVGYFSEADSDVVVLFLGTNVFLDCVVACERDVDAADSLHSLCDDTALPHELRGTTPPFEPLGVRALEVDEDRIVRGLSLPFGRAAAARRAALLVGDGLP